MHLLISGHARGCFVDRSSCRGARCPSIPVPVVPALTAQIARAGNLDGTTAMWVRDRLDGLWGEENFADWHPRAGSPASRPPNWPPSVDCSSFSACRTAGRGGGPLPHRLQLRHGDGAGRSRLPPERAGRPPRLSVSDRECGDRDRVAPKGEGAAGAPLAADVSSGGLLIQILRCAPFSPAMATLRGALVLLIMNTLRCPWLSTPRA